MSNNGKSFRKRLRTDVSENISDEEAARRWELGYRTGKSGAPLPEGSNKYFTGGYKMGTKDREYIGRRGEMHPIKGGKTSKDFFKADIIRE